jgi:hypothetical protein
MYTPQLMLLVPQFGIGSVSSETPLQIGEGGPGDSLCAATIVPERTVPTTAPTEIAFTIDFGPSPKSWTDER